MFARSEPELIAPIQASDESLRGQDAQPADLDKLKRYFAESAYKTKEARQQ